MREHSEPRTQSRLFPAVPQAKIPYSQRLLIYCRRCSVLICLKLPFARRYLLSLAPSGSRYTLTSNGKVDVIRANRRLRKTKMRLGCLDPVYLHTIKRDLSHMFLTQSSHLDYAGSKAV